MLKRLQRIFLRMWFVSRVIVAYVLIMALPIGALAAARQSDLGWRGSIGLAVAVWPFVILSWMAIRLLGKALRSLWRYWPFRLAAWCCWGFAVYELAEWNIRTSEEYALYAIAAEAVATMALGFASFIDAPSGAVERFFIRLRLLVPEKMDVALRVLHWVSWLSCIALIDRWLYQAVDRWLWNNWLTIPWGPFQAYRIPLASLPSAAFTVAAILARPPQFRRGRPRRVLRLRKVPMDLGEFGFWIFGQWALYVLVRERLFVPETLPDGRRVEAGERFAFGRAFWTGAALAVLLSVSVVSGMTERFASGLPGDLSAVERWQPVVSTNVYDRTGQLMCVFTLEDRKYAPLSGIPKHVQAAFTAAEDKDFDGHYGIDVAGIVRAGVINVSSGRTRQGASTITQQVIKLLVLKDTRRSYTRKLAEILLAVELERRMTRTYGREGAKDMIRGIYLNYVYLGGNAAGVEAASRRYFDKGVKDITIAEAAMLAGLPKAPSRDSPETHFDRAKVRQRYVLGRMFERGDISRAERDAALAEKIAVVHRIYPLNETAAPYACEHVRKWAKAAYGNDAIYKHGYEIRTTFDLVMQQEAQKAVRYGLLDLERRIGFSGPEGHDGTAGERCDAPAETVIDEMVEANARVIRRAGENVTLCVRGNVVPLDPEDAARVIRWERADHGRALAVGDLLTVRLVTRMVAKGVAKRFALTARRTGDPDADGKGRDGRPVNPLQAALVAIDLPNGEVRAIVGGYDWHESRFDFATQARRQVGSSVKPYVYGTGLMALPDLTVLSRVHDGPICVSTATGQWCPKNYTNGHMQSYYGDVDLGTALALSLNSVSVRLVLKTGIGPVVDTMRRLGIRSKIVPVFPLAVGTPELTLLEHGAGIASILSNGRALTSQTEDGVPGRFIARVTEQVVGPDGKLVSRVVYAQPPPDEAQAMPSGDAYAVTYLMKGVVESGTGGLAKTLLRPFAGKTGTTNDFRDAWFMGGSADLGVFVHVGRDRPNRIANEATGGAIALPIAVAFMRAVAPVTEDAPARDFPIPDDVTLVYRGERRGGVPALIPFQRGKVPASYLHDRKLSFGNGRFE